MTETRTVIKHLIQAALDFAAKDKTVDLQLAWYVEDYKVVAITNTTILKPGEWLSPEAVDQINLTKGWKVAMGDNAIIASLLGLGSSAVGDAVKIGRL